jgi:hypothetical protein
MASTDSGLAALQSLLPEVQLSKPHQLGGNERTHVLRIAAEYPDGNRASLITKQYSAGEAWVRESAALSVLPSAISAPRIVAAQDVPPVLILTDLGDGPSVADALTGRDPAAAEQAVCAWAQAMARLHGATVGARADFRAAIEARQGDLQVRDAPFGNDIEDAVRGLDRACMGLDVRIPAGAIDQLHALAKRLGASGLGALTPADACPDNNVLTDDGLALLDFEGAQWRHIAWDVAYLRVPWPSCWCSWRMPAEVSARAFDVYRATATPFIPGVADGQFERDVSAAAVGWALITTTWFLDNALGSDPVLNPDKPTPTRRAMITHRLAAAARSPELPALAELSAALGAALRKRWGDVPLAFAPVYRTAQ